MEEAARDAILLQTMDVKLQKKILAKNLSYVDTVKYGLAIEHGERKVEEIRNQGASREGDRMAALEEQVRQLSSKVKKKSQKQGAEGAQCRTCTRGPHRERGCPGLL